MWGYEEQTYFYVESPLSSFNRTFLKILNAINEAKDDCHIVLVQLVQYWRLTAMARVQSPVSEHGKPIGPQFPISDAYLDLLCHYTPYISTEDGAYSQCSRASCVYSVGAYSSTTSVNAYHNTLRKEK